MEKEITQPNNLLECFEQLDNILSNAEDAEWFKKANENEAISQSHYGLGTWIRNNWKLNLKKSNLYKYFNNLGLNHADDISEVILTSYHRHLNKKEMGLDKQIKECVEFWKNNKND